jgi:hypothetical protein
MPGLLLTEWVWYVDLLDYLGTLFWNCGRKGEKRLVCGRDSAGADQEHGGESARGDKSCFWGWRAG